MLMVKPALPYLDIISDASTLYPDLPVACYQVSGEYAMVYAGAEKGIYDLKEMAFETTESMVRAGESHVDVPVWVRSLTGRSQHHLELLYPPVPGLAG
jgi:porphobilinogen synthase